MVSKLERHIVSPPSPTHPPTESESRTLGGCGGESGGKKDEEEEEEKASGMSGKQTKI